MSGLRTALSEALGLALAARAQSRHQLEEELRGVLDSVRQEIARFLSTADRPAEAASKPLTEASLEAVFNKFSQQMITKIDEHIEARLDAVVARRLSGTSMSSPGATAGGNRHHETESMPTAI
jgi:hypothetical protein